MSKTRKMSFPVMDFFLWKISGIGQTHEKELKERLYINHKSNQYFTENLGLSLSHTLNWFEAIGVLLLFYWGISKNFPIYFLRKERQQKLISKIFFQIWADVFLGHHKIFSDLTCILAVLLYFDIYINTLRCKFFAWCSLAYAYLLKRLSG